MCLVRHFKQEYQRLPDQTDIYSPAVIAALFVSSDSTYSVNLAPSEVAPCCCFSRGRGPTNAHLSVATPSYLPPSKRRTSDRLLARGRAGICPPLLLQTRVDCHACPREQAHVVSFPLPQRCRELPRIFALTSRVLESLHPPRAHCLFCSLSDRHMLCDHFDLLIFVHPTRRCMRPMLARREQFPVPEIIRAIPSQYGAVPSCNDHNASFPRGSHHASKAPNSSS